MAISRSTEIEKHKKWIYTKFRRRLTSLHRQTCSIFNCFIPETVVFNYKVLNIVHGLMCNHVRIGSAGLCANLRIWATFMLGLFKSPLRHCSSIKSIVYHDFDDSAFTFIPISWTSIPWLCARVCYRRAVSDVPSNTPRLNYKMSRVVKDSHAVQDIWWVSSFCCPRVFVVPMRDVAVTCFFPCARSPEGVLAEHIFRSRQKCCTRSLEVWRRTIVEHYVFVCVYSLPFITDAGI